MIARIYKGRAGNPARPFPLWLTTPVEFYYTVNMKSLKRGKNISKPEVANISGHGFWMLIKGKEFFLPYVNFPWFRNATVGQISDFEMPNDFHIYWPQLDVDLSLAIIEHPEKYKLVSK